MADCRLQARSPLQGLMQPGRHGRKDGSAGLTVSEPPLLRIASLAARSGQGAALVAAVQAGWGIMLPTTPRHAGDASLGFLWAGPGQWLALAPDAPQLLEAELRAHLGGLASITEQGDGRVVLDIAGPAAREALSRLVSIDLHPRAFGPGDTAVTQAAHMGVQLWQMDEARYRLLAFRGYAASLLAAVIAAGETYGIDIPARG